MARRRRHHRRHHRQGGPKVHGDLSLQLLQLAVGGVTPEMAAFTLGQDLGTVRQLLSRLESRGLVERAGLLYFATEAGRLAVSGSGQEGEVSVLRDADREALPSLPHQQAPPE